ncbi:MAG: rod shape-determining protein MreC [Actinomycetota bacterium]|nr:rod shape-determining protein MreC [Actinomycetota bacterium]
MYRRTGRGRLLLLAFLALSILVITLDFRQDAGGPLDRAKDVSSAIVTPIQRGITAILEPIGGFFSSLSDLSNLREQNVALRNQVEEMEQRVTEADSILSENERLLELQGLDESYPTMERVSARVIGRPPANYKWAVTIDRGTSDGIRVDMAVIDPEGLVGKIIRAHQDTAIVLLLIDPEANAKARIKGEAFAGAVGGNGANEMLSLAFVDTDADVEVGDEVVTAGYDQGIFPPSIPIGTVATVANDDAALEQEITVDPYVDFATLDFVQVITETGDKTRARKD